MFTLPVKLLPMRRPWPRSGEQVYQAACFACHGSGALGAPKTAADWEPRLARHGYIA